MHHPRPSYVAHASLVLGMVSGLGRARWLAWGSRCTSCRRSHLASNMHPEFCDCRYRCNDRKTHPTSGCFIAFAVRIAAHCGTEMLGCDIELVIGCTAVLPRWVSPLLPYAVVMLGGLGCLWPYSPGCSYAGCSGAVCKRVVHTQLCRWKSLASMWCWVPGSYIWTP